jgi:hypothetical protein
MEIKTERNQIKRAKKKEEEKKEQRHGRAGELRLKRKNRKKEEEKIGAYEVQKCT